MKRVLMTDELFDALGASKVEWGEPDTDGFYSPTVYADTTEATLRAALLLIFDLAESRPDIRETARAALQQPAVQPEGERTTLDDAMRTYRAAVQPEEGPE